MSLTQAEYSIGAESMVFMMLPKPGDEAPQ